MPSGPRPARRPRRPPRPGPGSRWMPAKPAVPCRGAAAVAAKAAAIRGPLSGSVRTSVGSPRRPHALRERGVVDAAVLAADDQRDPPAGEGVEGGERRQHVGGQRVVDERDAADRADRGEAAGQRGEAAAAAASRSSSAAGGQAASPAAAARARARRGRSARCGGCACRAGPGGPSRSAPGSSVSLTHSTRGPSSADALAQQLAVAVGDGEVRARLGRGRQLVAVVALDAAVPGQVVGVQRRHGGDRRGHREVGRRVAGHLDHPVVVVARPAPGHRARRRSCRRPGRCGRGRAAGGR